MGADSLRIAFLGPMKVERAGREVQLPKSQKTRALLAYLIVNPREHLRDRLCRLFWDVADDPKAALRWSLSKLRALDDDGAKRIVADRRCVRFDPCGAFVDVLEVAQIASVESLSTERLEAAVSAFSGDFLDGVELADFGEFQAWRVAKREEFRRKRLALMQELLHRYADNPQAALAVARQCVTLAPDDVEARIRLLGLLVASGAREEAETHLELGVKRLESTGSSTKALVEAWRRLNQADSQPAVTHAPPDQDVCFATAEDGTRIAYASLGRGPVLVKTANWLTHLEYDWKSPLWRHLAGELCQQYTLVRYDQRGNGLSDWDVDDLSLEACVADLKLVVDTLELERFPLLGISQGCRVAVAFAAQFPDRVTHLVLYGGSPTGWRHRDRQASETRAGLQALIREGWGRDIPAFRQVFATLFMPGATSEQAKWFNELQAVSTSADNAVRITEQASEVDVRDLLPQVSTPTLVMHARRDAMVPFDQGRQLAAGIRGARFVELDSENHLLLPREPAFARFLKEIRRFLGSG